ncbi:MAG: phosphoglycolate phosphatase [Methanobacteriaceae archaeon]|jgi:phosphoglycolate phosphatase (TIGR01487 family)|nr:phosphoglycolate phosphatase [Candidatus Methanorudis spinitermitis]
MSKIKAIAVDIDGTITDENRRICISAIESIRGCEAINIPTIIVSGNIFTYSNATSILLGASGGVVAENGGVISEIHSDTQEIKVLGDIKKVKNAYNYLKSQLINKYNNKYELNCVDDSDSRLSEIAIYRTLDEKLIKEELKNFDVKVYDTGFALHITDDQVNKGSSLEIVAKKQGLKMKEIMAIGDSENDEEFLANAGFKVAVANADSSLKDIADYVTKEKYGDGVSEAIRKFIL